ncbi:DUF2207 domain-containing protein [Caldanaerobacter subterraneus KAk]|uniref:DUF2207 domain-containing protein n=1 Tax=Caldanaerobacter subterraneus TaxID=911092 RepID=UPI0032C15599
MKRALFLIPVVLFVFFMPFSVAYAKDYSLKEVKIYYFIQDNGEMDVTNDITYKFNGSFSEAWLIIPTGDYEIKDVLVSEIKDGKETPLNFDFAKGKQEYKITWKYKANNEIKTFRIKYKVLKGLRIYEDVAEFYWKVWGSAWDKSLPALWVEVNLPSKIGNIDDINYWLHPKIDGKIGVKKDLSGIIAYAGNIPSNHWLEVRFVFPKSYIKNLNPNNVILVSGNGRDKILAEEEAWQKREEEREILSKDLEKVYLILLPIFLALAVFIPVKIKRKYGKDPEVFYEGIYEREAPVDCPPAWVEMLLEKSDFVTSKSIVASTLELARRGYLKIQEEVKKGVLGSTSKEYKIIVTDREIEESLSEDLKALLLEYKKYGNEFYTSKIDGEKFAKFIERFEEVVKEKVYNDRKWIVTEKYKEVNKYVILWSFLTVLSFLSLIIIGLILLNGMLIAINVLFLIISVSELIFVAIYRFGIKKYSPDGKLLVLKWNAFKKFLKDFSLISQYPPTSLVIWEKYLVYGTILGVAKEVLKAMEILRVPVEEIDWYVPAFAGTMSVSNFVESFNSSLLAFSQSFSQNVMPSSSSGSSHGGGGGFGGGGGGAR